MKKYLISYDLVMPNRNYELLYEKIGQYNDKIRVLESVWIVRTDQSAKEIRDDFRLVLDNNDQLIVAALTGEAAWYNLGKEVHRWMTG